MIFGKKQEKEKPLEKPPKGEQTASLRYLAGVACVVIIVGGVRMAQAFFVPVFLAIFIAVILFPPLAWLRRRGFSAPTALLIIISGVVLVGFGVTSIVSSSINDFTANFDSYKTKLGSEIAAWDEWLLDTLDSLGQAMEEEVEPDEGSDEAAGGAPVTPPAEVSPLSTDDAAADDALVADDAGQEDPPADQVDADAEDEVDVADIPASIEPRGPPMIGGDVSTVRKPNAREAAKREPLLRLQSDQLMQWLGSIFRDAGGIISNAVIILVLAIFMLFEAAALPAKLEVALGKADPWNARVLKIAEDVRRYLVIKTWSSLLTGIGVAIMLSFADVDYAFLWGLLAFLFNYVPNIGSFIAAIPAILLTLIQHGFPTSLGVGIGYLIINNSVSLGLEPRWLGRGLGISPLVVFLSLLFWGWVLGPVGMFLSAPLTMIVKIVLESSPDTRWIAVLLSAKLPRNAPR